MVGSAIGTWWVVSRRRSRATAARDRGTVLFDNTPIPADVDAVI
jgi:hypothetical protein